jgi:hypothetical protein
MATEPDAFLDLPIAVEQALRHVPRDRIAAIQIFKPHPHSDYPDVILSNIYVAGAKNEAQAQPNHFRHATPADDDWMTVAQARNALGVFEMCVVWANEMSSEPVTERYVVGRDDIIVRFVADDFRVLDLKKEFNAVMGARLKANQPVMH